MLECTDGTLAARPNTSSTKHNDQFVVEECTDVAAKLCIPFGGRRGGICSALCRDGGVSERRIERLAGALHHQQAQPLVRPPAQTSALPRPPAAMLPVGLVSQLASFSSQSASSASPPAGPREPGWA